MGPVPVPRYWPKFAGRARGRRRDLPELVSRIENSAANPELDTLGKIADALGVYPGELLEE
jgi:transcriptional regulator with XRE-family HTH domain